MADRRSAASRERERIMVALSDGEYRTARDLERCLDGISAKRARRACEYLCSRGKLIGDAGRGWRLSQAGDVDG